MSAADDPAFPNGQDITHMSESGLTKREYFAAMAMQGMRAGKLDDTPEQIAMWAVADADALLAQLTSTEQRSQS